MDFELPGIRMNDGLQFNTRCPFAVLFIYNPSLIPNVPPFSPAAPERRLGGPHRRRDHLLWGPRLRQRLPLPTVAMRQPRPVLRAGRQ